VQASGHGKARTCFFQQQVANTLSSPIILLCAVVAADPGSYCTGGVTDGVICTAF
jgi:hypothetical protein